MRSAPAIGDFVYPGHAGRINVLLSGEHAARRAVLIAGYAITAYGLKPEYNVSLAVPLNDDAKVIERCMFGVNVKPKPDISWAKAARKHIVAIGNIGWEKYIAAQKAVPPVRGYYRRPVQLRDIALDEVNDRMIPLLVHGVMRQHFPNATMPLRVAAVPDVQ